MFHLGVKNVSPEKVSTKTLSIKFYLKPIKNKENTFVVHTQIVFNRTKAEFTTGLRCLNTEWNDSKEEFRKNSVYNQQLSTVKSKVFRIKNQLDESASFYNAADIKKQLLGNQQSDAKLLIYFEDYIQRNLKNDAWSKATRRLYSNTYNYLECFLSKPGAKRITLNQFDLILIGKFDDYLKQVVWNDLGARLSVSSINKHHARLKAVLNDAISRGELVNKNYSMFKLNFPSSNREYLTKEELIRINSLDFSHNKPLDAVRDIFMFSCYTGLRFCDAMELSLEDIMMINDEQHIRVDQIKTNERREIPLLTPALRILNKYSSAHFRLIKHKILPSYSNQRVNIYLKVIAAQAGIIKNLTHHIARHTCATTILLDNNVPIEVVSHWLGHTNIRTTQIYAKISHTKLQNQSQRLNEIVGFD
jgi:integrase/recombinase XerD